MWDIIATVESSWKNWRNLDPTSFSSQWHYIHRNVGRKSCCLISDVGLLKPQGNKHSSNSPISHNVGPYFCFFSNVSCDWIHFITLHFIQNFCQKSQEFGRRFPINSYGDIFNLSSATAPEFVQPEKMFTFLSSFSPLTFYLFKYSTIFLFSFLHCKKHLFQGIDYL